MWDTREVRCYRDKEALLRAVIAPHMRVLDVGFWGQAQTVDKATWPHRIIESITPYVWGVDLTYEETQLTHPERYQKASAEDFSFAEQFDVIVALDLIEHVTNVGLFLAQVEKHLAPGGKFVATTPNAFNLFAIAGKLAHPEPPTNADHTAYFNRRTIHTLYQKCGWSITEFCWLNGKK